MSTRRSPQRMTLSRVRDIKGVWEGASKGFAINCRKDEEESRNNAVLLDDLSPATDHQHIKGGATTAIKLKKEVSPCNKDCRGFGFNRNANEGLEDGE